MDSSEFRPMSRKGTAVSNSDSAMSASGRIGTASRLSALSSYRIGTSKNIGIPQKTTINAERPLTQQGLSGISTASGSNFRQVKDKRYWIALLQTKIQEIANETEKLNKEKKNMDRETSAKKLYEKKVKEQAKDLSTLHSQLSDLNLALNSLSGGSRQLHNETLAFREKNETIQNQLEQTFKDRQSKDMQNSHLDETITTEKRKMNEMIYSLSVEEQNKYRELQIFCEKLKDENVAIYGKIEEVMRQKEKFSGVVMNSQSRSEAVKLQSKLREMVAKRNQLKEEEMNRLSPAQEREKLISEVRINNQSIAAINKQLKIISDQLEERKQELFQLEQDFEEGSSERFTKFKELKKRDDMMESFQQSFPDQMKREKQNVEILKNQITFAIEQITLQGMNSQINGNTRISASLLNENSRNSHEGLVKEYGKLQIQLKQLKILEKRIRKQLDDMKSEEVSVLENIQKFNNLNALRDEYASKYEEIGNSLQDLKDKKRVTENVVKDSEKRNQSIKENLKSNETYRQISHMEEKMSDLIKDNKALEGNLKELNKDFNVSEVKSIAQSKLNEYNRILCDNIRSMTRF